MKKEKKLLTVISSVFLFLIFNSISFYARNFSGNVSEKLIFIITNIREIILRSVFIKFNSQDLAVGLFAAAVPLVVFFMKKEKIYRNGEEHGSGRFATTKEVRRFKDIFFDRNTILSKKDFLTLNNSPKNFKNARNSNILLIGGPGTGKTRNIIKPNIMQMHSSYVITDPKCTILPEVGEMLIKGGPKIKRNRDGYYKYINTGMPEFDLDETGKVKREPYEIKIFNTSNFDLSMHYNFFDYIHDEIDIMIVVNTLIKNTQAKNQSNDPLWENAERLFYYAIFGYMISELVPEDRNVGTMMEIIELSQVKDDNDGNKNIVDYLFEAMEEEKPEAFAVHQYHLFKLAAGKTLKSILISCAARLAAFNMPKIQNLMKYDELELNKIVERKTALFVITSDTDNTFNFLSSILYTQLLHIMTKTVDEKYGGEAPVPVQMLLDEFTNSGVIPDFEHAITTLRSRNISAMIVIQLISQLKERYKDASDIIVGGCDTKIFLGGTDETTLKHFSTILGKQTVHKKESSITKGMRGNHSVSDRSHGRELMTIDELLVMDNEECIVQIRGIRPRKSPKYDIQSHERYSLLHEGGNKLFSIKEYLNQNLKIKEEDVIDMITISDTEREEAKLLTKEREELYYEFFEVKKEKEK